MNEVDTLLAKVQALEKQVEVLQAVRDIERLQRVYGFYLEHWNAEDIVDLFADDVDVSLCVSLGEFKGKARIREFFEFTLPIVSPEFLHQLIQVSGVVDVDDGGDAAKGRWYAVGVTAMPVGKGVPTLGLSTGAYEVDYVKEDGLWKFRKIQWGMICSVSPKDGWVPQEMPKERLQPDVRTDISYVYPSGNVIPFHFGHPIRGRARGKQSEGRRPSLPS